MNEILNQITIEDFNEPFDEIATLIGVDNTIKIIRYVGGSTIYVPNLKFIIAEKRKNNIRQEFNGYNISELSKKYNLSTRWIREVLKSK